MPRDSDEPTWLQRYVVAPARFVLFILSLALIARKDDRNRLVEYRKSKSRVARRRNRSKGGSGSDSDRHGRTRSSSRGSRVLHSFQRKLGAMEVCHALPVLCPLRLISIQLRTAFLAEEFLTSMLCRLLLVGSAVVLLLYIRSCIWTDAA